MAGGGGAAGGARDPDPRGGCCRPSNTSQLKKCLAQPLAPGTRKVGIMLPGKRISNSQGARPGYQIISMIEWIRSSILSIKDSLSEPG